jgi:hypothetical protein
MGGMTCFASVGFQNLMDNFLFKDILFVARITGFLALCFEHIPPVRCMRIVAGGAPSFRKRSVYYGLIQPDAVFFVTRKTKLVPYFFEEQFRDHAMPQMALIALLVLHGSMDALHAEVLIRKFRMAVETVLSRKPLLRRGGICRVCQYRQSEYRDYTAIECTLLHP